jgi:anhydro-N-acetylmuramic acid kinase
MVYNAIGVMSGSALDGLDICYAQYIETGGQWQYEILATECVPYTNEWVQQLQEATTLKAYDYQLLHTAYGHYIGNAINQFIEKHQLQYKVALIGSHGHTTFHAPHLKMTAQLGDGAAIAAVTGLPVISDLRAMDIALGGHGAPIVPIGEKFLLGDYNYFLNLGGIANISYKAAHTHIAFDTSPANKILNLLIHSIGKTYDEDGALAATGNVHEPLLEALQQLAYYTLPYPKSLDNAFGIKTVFPIIEQASISLADKLATACTHIAIEIKNGIKQIIQQQQLPNQPTTLLATGGGALNTYLVQCIQAQLEPLQVQVIAANKQLVEFKEALIMGFMGVLRWREANNVLATVTGANKSSIGGALWLGGDA